MGETLFDSFMDHEINPCQANKESVLRGLDKLRDRVEKGEVTLEDMAWASDPTHSKDAKLILTFNEKLDQG